jgi:hypothetical protein
MVINPVDDNVGEPGRLLSWCLDEKLVKEGERLLGKVVSSKKFEGE